MGEKSLSITSNKKVEIENESTTNQHQERTWENRKVIQSSRAHRGCLMKLVKTTNRDDITTLLKIKMFQMSSTWLYKEEKIIQHRKAQ